MSTIVGTNIEVTNIKYDSDTTSMIISSAGQITAQGEGTATTNLQQGLAKVWCSATIATNTHTIQDSLNVTSLTDGGAGITSVVIANDMSNDDYAVSACLGVSGGLENPLIFAFFTKVLTSESEVLALSVNLPKYLSYCSFKFFIILNFLLCLPF